MRRAQYRVCPIFWTPKPGGGRYLKNLDTLEDLLKDGWRVMRVDRLTTRDATHDSINDTSDATLMYILEKNDDESATTYSSEQLDHECLRAWQEGYLTGRKDWECDFFNTHRR